MKFTLPQSYIDEGLVRVVSHPTLPLRLYNYTEHCQFEKKWDDITLQCRGLVVDDQDNIVARPFKKFFNYEEYTGTLPEGTPEIIEKVDGSLGIVFHYGGTWHVATRGSFASEQAEHASQLLVQKYNDLFKSVPKDFTHLFEIVYPQNRIVVDYAGKDELVYLGSVEVATGREVLEELFGVSGIRCAASYGAAEGEDILAGLRLLPSANCEGFVLRWPSGFRLKFKFEEYKRLHRILTNTTERSIWEALKEGQDIKSFIEGVPDEFHKWANATVWELKKAYNFLAVSSWETVESIRKLHHPASRSEWASLIKQYSKNPAICFLVLDGKNATSTIWKMIKPPSTKPFTSDT